MHILVRPRHLLHLVLHPFGTAVDHSLGVGACAADDRSPQTAPETADATARDQSGATWFSRGASIDQAEANLTSVEMMMMRLP